MLEVKNLTKIYGDGTVALRDVSFNVEDGEFLIFVHQDDRNVGVGTQLARSVLEKAKDLGLKKIWLMVGAYNFTAIRLYKKCGFDFYENPGGPERPMVIRL